MSYEDKLLDAINKGDDKKIKYLIEKKAVDVNFEGFFGEMPILTAIGVGYNIRPLKLLIEMGAKINTQNKYGKNPIFHCIDKENLGALALLIEKGAVLNFHHKISGVTPLIYAMKENKSYFINQLIKFGADVNLPDKKGVTPLHYAVKNNHFENTKLLVEAYKAEVNKEDGEGKTPLYYAFQAKNLDVFNLLLSAGAKIHLDSENKKGVEQYLEEELLKDPLVLMYQKVLELKQERFLKPIHIVQQVIKRRKEKGGRSKD